jgi:site-specific recombinase XerC
MALTMARPVKHPRTGVYWFRKAVPLKLRELVGKREVSRTLQTKDPEEARIRHHKVAAEVQAEWDALIAGREALADERDPLSPKELHGLAGEFYRWLLAKHDNDPGSAEKWREEAAADLRYIRPSSRFRPPSPGFRYRDQVKAFLHDKRLVFDDSDLWNLVIVAATAGVQAKETLARNAQGDYSPDPRAARFPRWEEVEPKLTASSRRLTLKKHWDAYVKERALAPSSVKRWRSLIQGLCDFAKTDNLAAINRQTVLDWKDALLKQGLKPQTIREANLAAVRSFFTWAVDNDKVAVNPAADIKLKVPKKSETKGRPFNDAEANLILSESLRPITGRTTDEFAAAIRWVPWLCAYTGARVNEMTQLRGCDVFRFGVDDENYGILITPAAGAVKGDRMRQVPLHPHLIEMGFIKYVEKRGKGPLFYDPTRKRRGEPKRDTRENPQYAKVGNKLGEWVRDIGVTDETVQPNHGWRHTFNRLARTFRMDPEVRDAIEGHAPRTEGEQYGGDVPLDVKWTELQRLPRFNVEAPTGPAPKRRSHAKKEIAEGEAPRKPGRPPSAKAQKEPDVA